MQYEPVPLSDQVIILFSGTNGYADSVPVPRMNEYEEQCLRYMSTQFPTVGQSITEEGRITEETEDVLREALDLFVKSWE